MELEELMPQIKQVRNRLRTTVTVEHVMGSEDHHIVVTAFGEADLRRLLKELAKKPESMDDRFSSIGWRKGSMRQYIENLSGPKALSPEELSDTVLHIRMLEDEIAVLEKMQATRQDDRQPMNEPTGPVDTQVTGHPSPGHGQSPLTTLGIITGRLQG